jgi:alpha-L-arabinofuranosidase
MNLARFARWAAVVIGGAAATVMAGGPAATPMLQAAVPPNAPHTATVSIDFSHPGPAIGPMMYGLMTEEINHAYDGGLYAELIQNRCFKDDANTPTHWAVVNNAKMSLDKTGPVNPVLAVSLKVDTSGGDGGVANDGFWGIPVKPNTTYTATFYCRTAAGLGGAVLTAAIEVPGENDPVATARDATMSEKWQKLTFVLKTPGNIGPTSKGRFVITSDRPESFFLSDVSLFPPTFNNRPNGDRIDLTEKLAAMKPAFIRLPGGNFLEGDNFPNRFDWKKEIGPVDQRPGHMGCWNYRSSDGFGLPEFLGWCDDVHAEPVLAVFAGYTLNHDEIRQGPKLQPYVDEALEEIEYLTGDTTTKWGKQRADDGHPAPMKLHYVEVGNEDFFDGTKGGYDGRFTQFFDAIRAKYPDLKIIATAHVKSRKPDLVDDHYYRSPRVMAFDSGHYDKASRNGSHVFVGEWASMEGKPTPDLNAALGDAAWLMGLENDADLVEMTCYAPLFVNVNPGAWQWPTNLIGYDNLTSYGSPSYYAQVMIGQNRGDFVVPTKAKVEETTVGAEPAPHGRIGVGTWHTDSEFKEINVAGNGDKDDLQVMFKPDLTGGAKAWATTGGKWAIKEGSIKPGKADAETWAMAGDPSWTDYTITLKARKTAGKEGFLILFRSTDANNFLWWNLGGWGNTRTQFEATYDNAREPFGPESDFKVETGRWYDLKLEVKGHHFRGYVDGQLVSEADEKPMDVRTPFFAQSSYDKAAGELVLKVVNMSPDAVDTAFDLTGADIGSTGKAIVLSGDPTAQNSIEEPTKIAPKEEALTGLGATFHRTFPAHSFTLIRIPAKVKG